MEGWCVFCTLSRSIAGFCRVVHPQLRRRCWLPRSYVFGSPTTLNFVPGNIVSMRYFCRAILISISQLFVAFQFKMLAHRLYYNWLVSSLVLLKGYVGIGPIIVEPGLLGVQLDRSGIVGQCLLVPLKFMVGTPGFYSY
jgi:hypothetical protein